MLFPESLNDTAAPGISQRMLPPLSCEVGTEECASTGYYSHLPPNPAVTREPFYNTGSWASMQQQLILIQIQQ